MGLDQGRNNEQQGKNTFGQQQALLIYPLFVIEKARKQNCCQNNDEGIQHDFSPISP